MLYENKQKALLAVMSKLKEASDDYYEAVCEHDVHECVLGKVLGNLVGMIDLVLDAYDKDE